MSRNEMMERIADLILDIERMRGETIDVSAILSNAGTQHIQEPELDR